MAHPTAQTEHPARPRRMLLVSPDQRTAYATAGIDCDELDRSLRRFGLSRDRLVAIDVLLPSGRLVTASAEHRPHLFQALGAGEPTDLVVAREYALASAA